MTAASLISPWPGPYGGLPPFERATPALIEEAMALALAEKRAEIAAIAGNAAPPTFENTILAIEASGTALARAMALYSGFASTRAVGDMPAAAARIAPLLPALDDEIAHNDALFARIDAVHADMTALTSEQRRLTAVIRDRLVRRGAGLAADSRARLAAINQRIAALQSQFNQNLIAEQDAQAVFVDSAAALAGLTDSAIAAAAAAAAQRGQPGRWAIPNARPAVWPVLTCVHDRDVRKQVRDMWMTRGEHDGAQDNRPVIAEVLKLRGEKARLLGYPTFAHFANADRMAGTPDTALALMQRAWEPVKAVTEAQIAEMQAIADVDGLGGSIRAWDKQYYAERLRQSRFGLDAAALKPYLELDNVLAAVFEAAGRAHGLSFEALPDAPVFDPDIRVYGVNRYGAPHGVIWFDLLHRQGKMRGSWQQEYRAAERWRGDVVSLSSVNSNLERDAISGKVLMGWEYANVLFHEFGHAMHMLASRSHYPTLGSMGVAWDMIELPALLNERWLYDGELLQRHFRHWQTGEPIPMAMVEGIQQAAAFDRVFSVQADFLAGAIIDMRMHLLADGGDVDALAVERDTLAELGVPEAIDLVMRVPHFHHAMNDAYAAGVYSYLWADVMAADVAEAFLEGQGLYDADVVARWRDDILSVGNTLPAAEAFRNFRGRDPDTAALMRRFDLQTA